MFRKSGFNISYGFTVIHCVTTALTRNLVDATLFSSDSNQSLSELLQWHAAKFLISIRENCKISVKATDAIVTGVTHLLDMYTTTLMVNYSIWILG